MKFSAFLFCVTVLGTWQASSQSLTESEQQSLLTDLTRLSAPEMAGRKPGTDGHKLAQQYLVDAFHSIGLLPFENNYRQSFQFEVGMESHTGVNILGYQKGQRFPDRYIVFTAHYDHLGDKGGKIHFGTDDNASGVAAMLHLARFFSRFESNYSMLFLATDAEEFGLKGAKAFLASPPIERSQIVANINLDMLSQGSRRNTLFVAGTRKQPQLKSLITQVQQELPLERFKLRTGHDSTARVGFRDRNDRTNWQQASDHGPFLKLKIPYLYFGVDKHKYYHSPKDSIENLDQGFYLNAVITINYAVMKLDQLTSW